MTSLKLKILATFLHLLSVDIQKSSDYRSMDEICDNIDRYEIISKSIVNGSLKTVCKEHKDNKFCWNGSVEVLAFNMAIMAWHESRLVKRIHEGKCWDNECDPVFKYTKTGKKYLAYHRAKSLWQLHKTIYITDFEWNNMVGTDLQSTTISATVASKIFAWSKNRCKSDIGAFSLYATGKRCKWSGAADRVWAASKYRTLAKNEKWVKSKLKLADKCN